MPTDDIAHIPLRARDGSIRAYATIDADDLPLVSPWRWSIAAGRYAHRSFRNNGKSEIVFLHRMLMGLSRGDKRQVDHINRNTLDCRRANLRFATHAENLQNVKPRTGYTSPHRGVSWAKREKRWLARLTVAGRIISLGYFRLEQEAAEAAKAARLTLMPFATD